MEMEMRLVSGSYMVDHDCLLAIRIFLSSKHSWLLFTGGGIFARVLRAAPSAEIVFLAAIIRHALGPDCTDD